MKKLLLSFLVLLPFASYTMGENGMNTKKDIPLYESDWGFLKEKFIT